MKKIRLLSAVLFLASAPLSVQAGGDEIVQHVGVERAKFVGQAAHEVGVVLPDGLEQVGLASGWGLHGCLGSNIARGSLSWGGRPS